MNLFNIQFILGMNFIQVAILIILSYPKVEYCRFVTIEAKFYHNSIILLILLFKSQF
jgi:hypothetical protein